MSIKNRIADALAPVYAGACIVKIFVQHFGGRARKSASVGLLAARATWRATGQRAEPMASKDEPPQSLPPLSAFVSEVERNEIRAKLERCVASIDVLGFAVGRSMFGMYRVSGEGHMTIDNAHAELVKRVAERRRDIARELLRISVSDGEPSSIKGFSVSYAGYGMWTVGGTNSTGLINTAIWIDGETS